MLLPERGAYCVDIHEVTARYTKYAYMFRFYDLSRNYYKNRLLRAVL